MCSIRFSNNLPPQSFHQLNYLFVFNNTFKNSVYCFLCLCQNGHPNILGVGLISVAFVIVLLPSTPKFDRETWRFLTCDIELSDMSKRISDTKRGIY